MDLGHLQIPKLQPETNVFVPDLGMRLVQFYRAIVDETDVGRAALTALANDARVEALEGAMISRGTGASRFDVKTLAMWWLWAANEFGREAASQHLDAFLDADRIPTIATLWILGVDVDTTVDLHDGYRIIPIDEMPDSREKESFQRIDFDMRPHSPPTPQSALCRTCETPKAHFGDAEAIPHQQELWDTTAQLSELALLLNAIDGLSCVPYFSTSYCPATTPIGIFGGSGGGYQNLDVLGYGTAKPPPDMPERLGIMHRAFTDAREDEKARLRRILSRLSQAKRRDQIEDKMLDLGIALEMALLDDNRNADQLALTFRLRGSWLLGNDAADRLEIYRKLRDAYSFRSQVAHTGMLCGSDATKVEQVRDAFPEMAELASRIAERLIVSGKPNWSALILGSI